MLRTAAPLLLLLLLLTGGGTGCGLVYRAAHEATLAADRAGRPGRYGPLTAREEAWAKTAWRYVEANTQWGTGTVNANEGYAVVSMWDVADVLAATVAARELGVIDAKTFNDRLSGTLAFLNRMPLPHGLPNRRYDARTGQPLQDDGTEGTAGWSAMHLGRLLVWLRLVRDRHPEYGEYADRAVLRWDVCRVVGDDGTLYGGDAGGTPVQEGRLGMEEYAARGFQAWGFSTAAASSAAPLDTVLNDGQPLLVDARDGRVTGERSTVTTLPLVLDGLEFDGQAALGTGRFAVRTWAGARAHARSVYEAQRRRYDRDRILTARTDHLLAGPPYFAFDTVWGDGYPWNTVAPSGEPLPGAALVATKAAFGLWALYPDAYTDVLMDVVQHQYDDQRGWLEGRHEQGGGLHYAASLSTNATVLEALLYKRTGRLFRPSDAPSHYARALADPFRTAGRCFPPERPGAR